MSKKKEPIYTDDELMVLCQKGDQRAIGELYRRYERKMLGVCMRYARNKMEAEDIMHDSFIKVLNSLDKYKGDGPVGGWIRRIMVNTSLNHIRDTMKYTLQQDIDQVYDIEDEHMDISGKINAEDMVRFLQELPTGYRTVFNLYVVEGYAHKEIADMLGVAESTSKTQLFMAKKALQQRINLEMNGR